ncbi:MAG: hypothetical protein IJD49_04320 [Clostridia bacterium]|nr:hypothetical protein [Clostridia bacterium]
MKNTVTINLEYEAAQELITAIESVLSHDNNRDFLHTDEYNALDELRDTLVMKSGG